MYGEFVLHLLTFSSHAKLVEGTLQEQEITLRVCVCVFLSHSGTFVFLVQRAVQAVQRFQGNVHPLLLQIALHLLLSLGELPSFCMRPLCLCVYVCTSHAHVLPAGGRVFVPAV